MKRDGIKKNFAFQFIYQFIILVIPLVVSPYLTRTLGDTQLGIYTYSYTIAYYFVIGAMLGINKYGQKVISAAQNDEEEIRKKFWALFTLHSIISLISTIAYFIVIFVANFDNKDVCFALGLYVVSALFDITWFFYGIDNFKKIVIRNLFIKILECVLIFLFVKAKGDVLIYTFIKSGSVLLSQFIMYGFIFKYVKPIKFTFKDMMIHFKPLITFAIFVLASLLYSVFDKTLLGIMCSKEDVAYYEYANRIIDIPKTFAYVLASVVFPKACMCAKVGETEKLNKYFKICLIFVFYICVGTIFGLFFIADDFALLYYGEDFVLSGEIMRWLVPVILLISMCNVLESLYLIPKDKELLLTFSIVIGAVVNVVLSSLLIYFYGVFGAIIGTLVAEFIQLTLEVFFCRKDIKILNIILLAVPFIASGIIMSGVIWLMTTNLETNYLNFVLEIMVGFVIYSLLISCYFLCFDKDKYEYKTKIVNFVKRRKNK